MSAPATYLVKEIFGPTVQGEGAHAGRACVFLRFAVCNLACTWCDTDFAAAGAAKLTAAAIVARLVALDDRASRMVVVTGGEPTLQWDAALADAIRGAGFAVHMETNGTRVPEGPVDWLTVSPKPRFHDRSSLDLADLAPSEVKVVVDDTVDAATLAGYEARYQSRHWFVQPCMDARYDQHLRRAVDLALARPRWRVALQLHKLIGVP